MAGFNFGKIGETISKVMDSDFIDIKRDISGKLQEVYSNIPCHIAYSSIDNPDPLTVDVKPIIQAITVHLQLWVDIRNNNFIVAKKIGSDGSIIATYSGRCGNPVVSQGRKKVLMQMNGTESDEPTPVPPENPARITILYYSGNDPIQDQAERLVETGQSFTMEAPVSEGYVVDKCYIDGDLQTGTAAHIDEVTADAEIKFVYAVSDIPEFFRFLVNGLYTRDDGSLASGWHLYKKINIDSVSVEDDTYTVTCDDITLVHEDGGQTLKIEKDARLVLIPGQIFVKVDTVEIQGGKATFTATPFTPTEAERNAYICGYYD